MNPPPDGSEGPEPFLPQGHVAGVPYDLHRPSVARVKARVWNSDDHRFFPPKSIGAGWTVNFYWLFHLARYFKRRRSAH